MSLGKLRQIAKDYKIPLYTTMTKQELEGILSYDTYSIGWRWNIIKNIIEPSEYKNAMRLLLSPVRDITKYDDVRSFLKNNKVKITLTTSPLRLPKIFAVLATLDLTFVDSVNIVLPFEYGKDRKQYHQSDIDNVSKFPKVNIMRTIKDYGPITKMLPVINATKNKSDIIISIDDDIGYPLGMVNEFIYQKVKHPGYIIETADEGQDFRGDISNFKKIWPSKRPRKPFVDLVEGWLGVAYTKGLVDTDEMEEIADLSKECLLSDDLVISYVLAKHKVPVVKVANKYTGDVLPYLYGSGEDALHKGGGIGTTNKISFGSDDFNKEKYEICLYDIKRYIKK